MPARRTRAPGSLPIQAEFKFQIYKYAACVKFSASVLTSRVRAYRIRIAHTHTCKQSGSAGATGAHLNRNLYEPVH